MLALPKRRGGDAGEILAGLNERPQGMGGKGEIELTTKSRGGDGGRGKKNGGTGGKGQTHFFNHGKPDQFDKPQTQKGMDGQDGQKCPEEKAAWSPTPVDGAVGVACAPLAMTWEGDERIAAWEVRIGSDPGALQTALVGIPEREFTWVPYAEELGVDSSELYWQVIPQAFSQTEAGRTEQWVDTPVWHFATGEWRQVLLNPSFEAGRTAWTESSRDGKALIWRFATIPGHIPSHAPPDGQWFTWLGNREAALDVIAQEVPLGLDSWVFDYRYWWLRSPWPRQGQPDSLTTYLDIGGQPSVLHKVDASTIAESWAPFRITHSISGGSPVERAVLRVVASAPQATEFHTDLHELYVCKTKASATPVAVVEPLHQAPAVEVTTFTATAGGFAPRESISRWLVGPEGNRLELPTVTADARGRYSGPLHLRGNLAAMGTWTFFAQGARSGAETHAYFSILPGE